MITSWPGPLVPVTVCLVCISVCKSWWVLSENHQIHNEYWIKQLTSLPSKVCCCRKITGIIEMNTSFSSSNRQALWVSVLWVMGRNTLKGTGAAYVEPPPSSTRVIGYMPVQTGTQPSCSLASLAFSDWLSSDLTAVLGAGTIGDHPPWYCLCLLILIRWLMYCHLTSCFPPVC